MSMKLSKEKAEAITGLLIQALEAMLCNKVCYIKVGEGEEPTDDEAAIGAAILDCIPVSISLVVLELLGQLEDMELDAKERSVLSYWLGESMELAKKAQTNE